MLAQTLDKSGADESPGAGDFRARSRKSPTRILVVDDEPLVRWSIAQTLEPHGYDVAEAGDRETAMRAIRAAPAAPDVVLLDLRLPDCCDLSLLATVRRLLPTALVILMTAFGTREMSNEALRLGADRVMDKPFDLNGLHGLLADAVEHRRGD
jgi:DNA-binding NtrC family response regulator